MLADKLIRFNDTQKSTNTNNGRYEGVQFNLNTNEATYIENVEEGYHSYTFEIYNYEDNFNLTNIVLVSYDGGQNYEAYLTTYILTQDERNQLSNGIALDLTDKTTIEPFNIDQISIYSKTAGGTCYDLEPTSTACPCNCWNLSTGECTDPVAVFEWQEEPCPGDSTGGGSGSAGNTSGGGGSNGSGDLGSGDNGSGNTDSSGSTDTSGSDNVDEGKIPTTPQFSDGSSAAASFLISAIGEDNLTQSQIDWINNDSDANNNQTLCSFILGNSSSDESINLVIGIIDASISGSLITPFPFVKYPEDLSDEYKSNYPNFTEYLTNELIEIKNDQNVIDAITQLGTLTEEQVIEALTWGSGPELRFTPLSSDNTILGRYNPAPVGTDDSAYGPNVIEINSYFADLFEQNLNSDPMQYDLKAFKFFIAIVILHELSHYADYHFAGEAYVQEGVETGDLFEEEVFFELKVEGEQFEINIDNFEEIIQQYFLIRD